MDPLCQHLLVEREEERGQDSNLRPSGYEPDELPDCSTPHYHVHYTPMGTRVSRNRVASLSFDPRRQLRSSVRFSVTQCGCLTLTECSRYHKLRKRGCFRITCLCNPTVRGTKAVSRTGSALGTSHPGGEGVFLWAGMLAPLAHAVVALPTSAE